MKAKLKKHLKKVSKMTSEELDIAILKSKIEEEKQAYERYKEVLKIYAFSELGVCSGGPYFKRLYFEEVKNKGAAVLREALFSNEKTEKERLQKDLEYHKLKTERAKHMLESLSDKIKDKILEDSISKYVLWTFAFDVEKEVKNEKTRNNKKSN